MDGLAVLSCGLMVGRREIVMVEKISISVTVNNPAVNIDISDKLIIEINVF